MKDTIKAQKNRLTREINSQKNHVNLITEMWERQKKQSTFWYFGERKSVFYISIQASILNDLVKKRAEMNN